MNELPKLQRMPSSLATSTALITDGIIALPPSKLIGLSSSRKSFCKRPQSQWRERETEKEIKRERERPACQRQEEQCAFAYLPWPTIRGKRGFLAVAMKEPNSRALFVLRENFFLVKGWKLFQWSRSLNSVHYK